MSGLASRVDAVRDRIEAGLEGAARPRGSIQLVAVSKSFPPDVVAAGARAGLTVFGENRVQEAAGKIPLVSGIVGQRALAWHLVGHLQSNKARLAVPLFDLIHSLDDEELARKLAAAAAAAGKRQRVLVQVNVSGESTKSGIDPAALIPLIETIARSPHLELRGLMTIPPHDPDPERSRPHFAALRALGGKVRDRIGPDYPGELSMGMSDDFEVAIAEGATIVRIGRALFGERRGSPA